MSRGSPSRLHCAAHFCLKLCDFSRHLSSSSSFIFKAHEISKSIQIKAGTTRQETALTVALKIHINTSTKHHSKQSKACNIRKTQTAKIRWGGIYEGINEWGKGYVYVSHLDVKMQLFYRAWYGKFIFFITFRFSYSNAMSETCWATWTG